MDVLGAIRKRVGDDFIIGFRYTADEAQKGGITPEEGIDISKRLAASGQVDFLNVIRGRIHTDPAMTDVIPVQGMKSAPHLDFAGEVRRATGMPTFHAARIPDVATARHAVASGLLDMVGMTRAHMADPHIVQKIIEGREEDIRPCVGATYCLDRIYQAGEALCTHNAATGRELTMPHRVRGRRRTGRTDPPDRAKPAPARDDRDHRLAHGPMRGARREIPLQHLRRGRRCDRAQPRCGHCRHWRPAQHAAV
jgi:hypothetical protein